MAKVGQGRTRTSWATGCPRRSWMTALATSADEATTRAMPSTIEIGSSADHRSSIWRRSSTPAKAAGTEPATSHRTSDG